MAKVLDIILRGSDKTKGAFDSVNARTRKAETRFGKFRRSFGNAFGSGIRMARSAVTGVAAVGTGMLAAAKRTETLNKQIAQVATLADISIPQAKSQVKDLSVQFGLAKDELTKGLYDALSAGVPKENAFTFLETAAKGAVAGAATTAESVDILTTALNSFNIPASKADEVSDSLFATIKLGKTTMSELAQSFSKVAPLASSSGVAMEEVLAATASLTKQGTPTAEAMTQIRAALLAMNEELDDGWSKTMTLQEGMEKMFRKAGGSATELKKLTGRVEGTLSILAMAGTNASSAATDLGKVKESAGAAGDAFATMEEHMTMSKGIQAIDNLVDALGQAVLDEFADDIDRLTESLANLEKNGDIRDFVQELTRLLDGLSKLAVIPTTIYKGAKSTGQVLGAFGQGVKEAVRESDRRAMDKEGLTWEDTKYIWKNNPFKRTGDILRRQAETEAYSDARNLTLPQHILDRIKAGELSQAAGGDPAIAQGNVPAALRKAREDNSDIIASQDRMVKKQQETNDILREAISFGR